MIVDTVCAECVYCGHMVCGWIYVVVNKMCICEYYVCADSVCSARCVDRFTWLCIKCAFVHIMCAQIVCAVHGVWIDSVSYTHLTLPTTPYV